MNAKFGSSSPVKQKKWVAVGKLTNLTKKEEKNKQRIAKKIKERHRKKFLIPMAIEDYEKRIEDQGFHITYNPPKDGNCQFSTLANLLRDFGIFRSPETLRKEIVKYLEKNPMHYDGFSLLEFVPQHSTWEEYLLYMVKSHTFGDQLTLYAAANIYNIEINLISSLGCRARHQLIPHNSDAFGSIYVGHFAGNQGDHYVALSPQDNLCTVAEAEKENNRFGGPRSQINLSAAKNQENEEMQFHTWNQIELA